jgi:hypothetical protein
MQLQRLIIATSDSAAGAVKVAGIAEQVIALSHGFLFSPAPQADGPEDFFATRAQLLEPESLELHLDAHSLNLWSKFRSAAESFNAIEIWCDPDAKAQVQLLQILAWLGDNLKILDKTKLVHLDACLGDQTPEAVAQLCPYLKPIDPRQLTLAGKAWAAYAQPTPMAWSKLLDREDLDALPRLAATVLQVLLELPDLVTGLTATQRTMLDLIDKGVRRPLNVLCDTGRQEALAAMSYWQRGALLNDMASCGTPAISGLQAGPFTLELHDDVERFERYRRSSLELTDFGKAMIAGEADFAAHNRIDRWWGGTRITNENLWRWDAVKRCVVKT